MITLRARWVLPIVASPIDDGWVAIEGARIVAAGAERRRGPRPASAADVDLGRVALLPGLVNAHTHFELAWLAGRVPAAARFTDWVRELMALRRTEPDPSADRVLAPMHRAILSSHAAGAALVGDVGNTLVSVPALVAAEQPATVFFELLRFRASEADAVIADALLTLASTRPDPYVRVALAAHAPYSVSPRLFRQIQEAVSRTPAARTSVHVGESPEEIELLAQGTGPWRTLLEALGAWDDQWQAPRATPVEYLDGLGVLGSQMLAVHGVQLTWNDLRTMAARGAALVTCPRSNRYVGVGHPPVARFYESGVRVAVGTDSLASAPDLSLWSELRAMRALAPDVPASRLLESATRTGAEALGFSDDFGTIEAGRRAALIAVEIPPGIDDVEEYLVSGIETSQVRWVEQ
jgi:cytosine/adenosine deaminase-related metal-dependent hydrolase